jgi:hypothetical protein
VEWALWLLAILGVLGAFDTLYYHEWKARLPARGPSAHSELKLHAARDFIYALVFCSLPWFAFQGLWAVGVSALLAAEIFITLADFVVEDKVRRPLGGVYPGERTTHAIMGIVYGAMLANLAPVLLDWLRAPTGLIASPIVAGPAAALRWALVIMGVGVFISGVRDTLAVLEFPYADWPWRGALKHSIPTE